MNNEFDINLFLTILKEFGAKITKTESGQGGIFVKGHRVTVNDLFHFKECYGLCERCVWKRNGGCSEWN